MTSAEIDAATWNALAAEGISDTPFARHEYLAQWWSTGGGGEWTNAELALISASDAGHLIGLAPLFIADHEGQRSILLVGSIEISDYLDLIVRDKDHARFLAALLDCIAATAGLQGLPLDWYNVLDSSPTLPALKSEAERRGWSFEQEVYRPTRA